MLNKLLGVFIPWRLYRLCQIMGPWCLGIGVIAMAYGLIGGLWLSPPDYQQGEGFRIIYVHVPCALLSLVIYGAIVSLSFVFIVWRIKMLDVIAHAMAPIGAFFTASALLTGAIWGKPMWGTWWVWDARLTSELILLFLYLGYIGLYQAVNQSQTAAKACAILALVGAVDLPIIHYSVYWWNTLHQGASLSLSGSAIEKSMLFPLLSMIVGFVGYTLALLCWRVSTEILRRYSDRAWVSHLLKKEAMSL